jgi:hypothetical protein
MSANQIDITREYLTGTEVDHPNHLLQEVAASLHPDGTKYKGSFACHIYEVNGKLDMVVKSQIAVDNDVPSPQGWLAVKELIKAARRHYGHEDKDIAGNDF